LLARTFTGVVAVDPNLTTEDPGSGESAGARDFTLKFTVNFNDLFEIPTNHGKFQRFVYK
jgi:hypothetical protein